MNLKSFILPLLAATLLAAGVRYYFPRVETKTVTVTKTVIQRDVRTVTRIVEHKDGTRETVIDTVDRSTEEKDTSKVATKLAQAQWHLSASASQTLVARGEPIYGLQAERRILGPIFVGIKLDSDRQAGISLGMEF